MSVSGTEHLLGTTLLIGRINAAGNDHSRRQATHERVSIVEVASMTLIASDVLDGMGPIDR